MLCSSGGLRPRREDKKLHMEKTQGSKKGTGISDSQAQKRSWFSDNQNVVSILMIGSKSQSLLRHLVIGVRHQSESMGC